MIILIFINIFNIVNNIIINIVNIYYMMFDFNNADNMLAEFLTTCL